MILWNPVRELLSLCFHTYSLLFFVLQLSFFFSLDCLSLLQADADSDDEISLTPAWMRKPPPGSKPANAGPVPLMQGRNMGPPVVNAPAFSGPSAFDERGMGGGGDPEADDGMRQRAMDLYNKELNDGIIFQGDDAAALRETIKVHQAHGGNEGGGVSYVYGVDLASWPPNKPLLVCAAEYGRTKIVETLVPAQPSFPPSFPHINQNFRLPLKMAGLPPSQNSSGFVEDPLPSCGLPNFLWCCVLSMLVYVGSRVALFLASRMCAFECFAHHRDWSHLDIAAS